MNGSSRDITETDTFSVLLTRSPSPIRVLEPWRIERFVRDYWSVLSGDCRDAAAIGQHLRDTQGRIVRHRKGCHLDLCRSEDDVLLNASIFYRILYSR